LQLQTYLPKPNSHPTLATRQAVHCIRVRPARSPQPRSRPEAKGEARSVDLAECLGISPATVNKTVARLQRDGYLTAERYRSIFLTDKGEALAAAMRERHRIVYDFLRAIGVSADTAELDAEGLEHHVSDETLACFQCTTPASRGCVVTLLSWICRFAIRLSAKLAVALGAAIAAGILVDDKVQWVDGAVEGAISGTDTIRQLAHCRACARLTKYPPRRRAPTCDTPSNVSLRRY